MIILVYFFGKTVLLIKKKYFTLIELLVVIAVLAILMSILIPSLRKAVFRAREVECLNNFSQWGKANINYAEDYNGLYLGTNRLSIGMATGLVVWDIDPSCVENAVAAGLPNSAKLLFCPLYTYEDLPYESFRKWMTMDGQDITMNMSALEVNKRWSTRWPGLALSAFSWWMIRQAGNAWIPNALGESGSSVKPTTFPERTQDGILDVPIMSDFMVSETGSNPGKLPIYADGGHSYNGLVESTSLVYPDGSAKLQPIEEVKLRNEGNRLNFY